MSYDAWYHIDGKLESVNSGDDPEALLAEALGLAWEEGTSEVAGFLIFRDDGVLYAAATVRAVHAEGDGELEVYKPGEPPYRVRCRYVLDAGGLYDRTEVTRVAPAGSAAA